MSLKEREKSEIFPNGATIYYKMFFKDVGKGTVEESNGVECWTIYGLFGLNASNSHGASRLSSFFEFLNNDLM